MNIIGTNHRIEVAAKTTDRERSQEHAAALNELEIEIDPIEKLVRMVYYHHPTFREWEKAMRSIFSDPRFCSGFNFLFDKRRAGKIASNRYVEDVAAFYRENQDRLGRCAIVDDVLAFGMSRMTEGYCMDEDVRAFMNIDEALSWLRGSNLGVQAEIYDAPGGTGSVG